MHNAGVIRTSAGVYFEHNALLEQLKSSISLEEEARDRPLESVRVHWTRLSINISLGMICQHNIEMAVGMYRKLAVMYASAFAKYILPPPFF
jgi:hypothetical protein